jgi:hypothetical protein
MTAINSCFTKDLGIHFTAEKDIQAGFCFYEEPILCNFWSVARVCNFCLYSSDKLLKCSQCKNRSYCSVQCQKKDWKTSHKTSCPALRNLLQFNDADDGILLKSLIEVLGTVKLNPSLMDNVEADGSLNLSPVRLQYEGKLAGLFAEEVSLELQIEMASLISQVKVLGEDLLLSVKEMMHVIKIIRSNGHGLFDESDDPIGGTLLLRSSWLSHSCRPNCQITFHGRVATVTAIRHISIGEPLTITYINHLTSKATRQSLLFNDYGFHCACEFCKSKTCFLEQFQCLSCNSPSQFGLQCSLCKWIPPIPEFQNLESILTILQKPIYYSDSYVAIIGKMAARDFYIANENYEKAAHMAVEVVKGLSPFGDLLYLRGTQYLCAFKLLSNVPNQESLILSIQYGKEALRILKVSNPKSRLYNESLQEWIHLEAMSHSIYVNKSSPDAYQ